MSYCLNSLCEQPQNPAHSMYCQSCGAPLCLKNRYRALKLIGQGGFGRTFLAIDESQPLKPRCVIKQFFPQQTYYRDQASELFQQEALRLQELGQHAQIPELLDYLEQDEHQYLIQEFVDGCDLEQELSQAGNFSEAQIRELLQSLLPIVQFIHDHQVIHRDIKPANIIRRQSDRCLFLVDLGAAKQVTGTALAKTGTVIGSAEYVAPEQARGKAVFASDLYSLGATCIHLLTGISPFNLFDSSEDRWVWSSCVQPPVSISLERVLNRLLQNATNHRYQSAHEVLADLETNSAATLNSSKPVSPSTVQHSSQEEQKYAEFGLKSRQASKLAEVNFAASGKITSKPLRDRAAASLPMSALLLSFLRFFLIMGVPLLFLKSLNTPRTASSFPQLLYRQGAELGYSPPSKFLNPVQPIRTLSTSGVVLSLAISPDGKRLVSGNDDSRPVRPVRPAFDQMGETVSLQKQHDSNLQIWDFHSGALLHTIPNDYPVFSVAFSPDGKTIASSSVNISVDGKYWIDNKEIQSTIRLWNSLNGSLLRNLAKLQSFPPQSYSFYRSIAFSPDGKFLASNSQEGVTLWNLATEAVRQIFNQNTRAFVFSPDHQTLATYAAQPATIRFWNWRNGSQISTLTADAVIRDGDMGVFRPFAISQDGQTLVTTFSSINSCSGQAEYSMYNCSEIEIWNLKTKKLSHSLKHASREIRGLAISPDGKLMATAANLTVPLELAGKVDVGKIHLWDLQTGQLLRLLSLPTAVFSVVFSPDGKHLITGGDDEITSSPDGKTVTTVGKEPAIKVWRVDQLISGKQPR